ncbi:hypothetical protein A6R68_19506, partial [Neotoma lepida]
MNWLSSSPGVVLTAYHPSGKDQVVGESHAKGGEEATSSRRYGQYTMNQESSTKITERPPFDRSNSQDSLDEVSMEDYWTELENIKKSNENRQGQEAVVVKEPDEGELEEEWLKEAGLSNLFGESADDPQESMAFLATLTRTQAAAVQKRVETVSQTLRKKNKQHHIPDVRDIFAQQREAQEKMAQSRSQSEQTKTNAKEKTASSGAVDSKELIPRVPEDTPASETDINLEVSFAEQAVNQKELSKERTQKMRGNDTSLPNLCQELEAKFYEGTFNWESVKQHDAASLLKLFLRELPQPLLSVEYLKAFQAVQNLPTKKEQLQALNLLVILLPDANRDTLKALLEFLQRLIDNKEKNKMTVVNVAMVMAPNLFMCHTLGLKSSEQREFEMAAGTANVMHLLIKYQKLLWTIPKFIVNQVRKQNTENQKKERRAMKKLLKKMAYDREKHEKQDKTTN